MKLIRCGRCPIDVGSTPVTRERLTASPVIDKFLDQFANATRNILKFNSLFMHTGEPLAGNGATDK